MITPLFIILTLLITTTFGQDLSWIDNYSGQLKDVIRNIENRMDRIEGTAQMALQKATESRQGCQSGVFGEHTSPESRFPVQTRIDFNPPFAATPAVSYGLYLLDSSSSYNLRVNTSITKVSPNGFDLKISTWGDTFLYGARISWMACPKNF